MLLYLILRRPLVIAKPRPEKRLQVYSHEKLKKHTYNLHVMIPIQWHILRFATSQINDKKKLKIVLEYFNIFKNKYVKIIRKIKPFIKRSILRQIG